MKKCIPVLLMLTILICGCSKQAQESTSEPVSDTFFAMDTTMDFRIYGDKSLLQDAQNVITDLEKKVSVTDSDSVVRYGEDKPGISNLMDIYSCVTGRSYKEIEKEFDGKGYGDFKLAVGEAVADELAPLQKRYEELMAEKTYLDSMIKANDEKAQYYATKTLRKVQKKVGLTERIR